MTIESRGIYLTSKIDEVERELRIAELNDRIEVEDLKSEIMEMESELRSLGY